MQSNMSKQTAMQMAISHYENESTKGSNTAYIVAKYLKNYLEMDKQQIIDACNQTQFEDIDGMGIHETITKGEEQYNETFNK